MRRGLMLSIVPVLLAPVSLAPVLLAGCEMSEPAVPKVLVFFQHGSTTLDAAGRAQVEGAARNAIRSPASLVTVAGYAAADGSLDADQRLASTRAQVVASLLEGDGVSASRIDVMPRAPSNEDATVGSRRVEISIGDPSGS